MSLFSGLHTALIERRLPYRVSKMLDRTFVAVGRPEKIVRTGGLSFRIRRGTCDEDFVHNVVAKREYLPDGMSIRPGDTVVDIGGNIGTFAVLAASMGARVISAEPDADNLRLLRANVAINNVADRVTIAPVAVSDIDGPLTFYASPEGGGFHTLVPGYRLNMVPRMASGVTLRTLFERYGLRGCDFLKLDCEGAEFAIFDTWPDFRVRQIAMEYHLTARPGADVLGWSRERGYHVVAHEPFPLGGHLFLTS
jgi:FkbM family methyltransferase